MAKRDVVIVSACRTPIGAFGGSLSSVSAPELAAIAIKEAINRAKIEPDMVQDVRFGNCLENVDALNTARVAALLAGLPYSVPAVTLNRVCISGMEAALSGAWQIQSGFTDVVVAGGVEVMSQVPYVIEGMRWGVKLGTGVEHKLLKDALTHGLHAGSFFVPYPKDGPLEEFRGKPYIMGLTAEFLARKNGITREEQDEVALRSHNLAQEANEKGYFKDEMVPVTVKTRKGEKVVDRDEHYRPNLTMEDLARLRPAFLPGGTVTAGNSSGINDGASAMVLMSEEKADELGLKPLGKIAHMGMGANEPHYMGESPIPAVKDLLRRSGLKIDDFERIEVNEAFAAQYISVERALGLNREITNVHGSGIGLGHPVGCTGNRIMVTLLYELIHSKKDLGLATLCGGGGVSMAVAIERM